jgi:hypothetical protein
MDQETQKILQRCQLNRWKKDLILKFGSEKGAIIHQNALAKYEELLGARKIQTNQVLDRHLIYMILPPLALYESLLSSGLEKPQALETIDHLQDESLQKSAKALARLGHLPFFYTIFRKMIPKNTKQIYPPEGWDIHWIENSNRRIAYDVNRCFIHEIFKSYGREELTYLICKTDDIMHTNISPSIRWERTKTIGNGADICDFRFIRIHKDPKRQL